MHFVLSFLGHLEGKEPKNVQKQEAISYNNEMLILSNLVLWV